MVPSLSHFCDLCHSLSVHQATIKRHKLPIHNHCGDPLLTLHRPVLSACRVSRNCALVYTSLWVTMQINGRLIHVSCLITQKVYLREASRDRVVVCVSIYVCVCWHVCMCVCMNACIFMNVYVCVLMYVGVHVCISVCVCIHIIYI